MKNSRVFLVLMLLATGPGCSQINWLSLADYATPEIATVRRIPKNPLAQSLNLKSRKGPEPTERTKQLLRKYDLTSKTSSDPRDVLSELQQIIRKEPTPENMYAYAEMAYIFGAKAILEKDEDLAFDMFGASVVSSYAYLFDPKYDQYRNPYDPQFRRASDLYNLALEGALRIVNKRGMLRPGTRQGIESGNHTFDIAVTLKGPWHTEDIDHFEFVSDYEVTGLANHHHTYGLGVPLIAVRKSHEDEDPAEAYYPEGLTFAVTAFLRVAHDFDDATNAPGQCELELYDPLTKSDVWLNDRLAPLETDLSTPLAVFLNHPLLRTNFIATFGLLDANAGQEYRGLYMLEPFDPNKIPVVMVHGLWSSPATWMDMFNDLRAAPDIRNRYQFWFYLYPTGQPFWISATQMRSDMDEMRQKIDPHMQSPALGQMVLIGHSMGGLVSTYQTLESGDNFWNTISHNPIEELVADEETKYQLGSTLFFHPNESVRRVITIATPHRGSQFSNSATRYVGRSLIKLPKILRDTTRQIVRDNPDFFHNTDLLTITTSIDSLSPDSPILPAMQNASRAPWVTYHSIVGEIPNDGFIGRWAEGSDGVVSLESAHVTYAQSEITVPADHSSVHSHPRAILEVQRILRDHSRQMIGEATAYRQRTFRASFNAPAPAPKFSAPKFSASKFSASKFSASKFSAPATPAAPSRVEWLPILPLPRARIDGYESSGKALPAVESAQKKPRRPPNQKP